VTGPIYQNLGGFQRQAATPTLRVSDLGVSERFYRDLFGFVRAPGVEGGAVTLRSPLSAYAHVSIRLAPRDGSGSGDGCAEPGGFRMEVESSGELLDVYMLARLLGVEAEEPEFRRGLPVLRLLDPDGHQIEIEARPLASPAHYAHFTRARDDAPARFARGDGPPPYRGAPACRRPVGACA
jgi:hypothetical protein